MNNLRPTDPDIRYSEFRSNITLEEHSMRRAIRVGDVNTVASFLQKYELDNEQIEGSLLLAVASFSRNQDPRILECVDLLLERLTRPIMMLEVFIYARHPSDLIVIRKFINNCTTSVASMAVVHASKNNNQDLFDLLYPVSDWSKAQGFFRMSQCTKEERFLFDERTAQEDTNARLQQVVAECGVDQRTRKL